MRRRPLDHARRVIVLKPQEYENWLGLPAPRLVATQDAQPTALDFAPPLGTMVDQGGACGRAGLPECHTTDGRGTSGPPGSTCTSAARG